MPKNKPEMYFGGMKKSGKGTKKRPPKKGK